MGAGLSEGEPSTADSLHKSSNASWLWSSAAINGRSAASLPNLDLNLDGVTSPTGESIEVSRVCFSMEVGDTDRGGRDGESDSTRETWLCFRRRLRREYLEDVLPAPRFRCCSVGRSAPVPADRGLRELVPFEGFGAGRGLYWRGREGLRVF